MYGGAYNYRGMRCISFINFKVPLNGHGCIMERVEAFSPNRTLREALAKATDVIVVAHSQGVPVGTLLLERLYAEGAMEGIQSITLVSMAGIFHGPFPQLGMYNASMTS